MEQAINECFLITFAETITNVSILETITLLKTNARYLMFVACHCSETHKLTVAPAGTSSWCPRLAAPHSAQPSCWRASGLADHVQFSFLTQRVSNLELTC